MLRGRCSNRGWRVMPVALRIVNDVSFVTRINHESHSTWKPQYLVRLEGGSCCSAHCKLMFDMSGGSMMRVIFRGRRSIW